MLAHISTKRERGRERKGERKRKRERERGSAGEAKINSALRARAFVRCLSERSISLTMATIFRRDSIIHMRAARIWPVGRSESSRACKDLRKVLRIALLWLMILYRYFLFGTITSIERIYLAIFRIDFTQRFEIDYIFRVTFSILNIKCVITIDLNFR